MQGRIDQILNKKIAGKLQYTADVQVPFLNYFFTDERFAGQAGASGYLAFADGSFFTQGNLASDAVEFDGWRATKITGEYVYAYPERCLSLRKFKGSLFGGTVSGE